MNTNASKTHHLTLNRPLVLVAISFWIGVLIVALVWTISFWWLLSLAAVSLVVWRGLPDRFRYAHYPLALLFSITHRHRSRHHTEVSTATPAATASGPARHRPHDLLPFSAGCAGSIVNVNRLQ